MTGVFIPGHQYTPAEYEMQKSVESFGNLLFESAEHRLPHTYPVAFRFRQLELIDHLVLTYLHTGALRYEAFSKAWLFDGDT